MAPTILLLGKNGQVGFELVRSLSLLGNVVALGRVDCDLSDEAQIRSTVARTSPAVIVNAAAYTLVDQAEENVSVAESINATAVGVLAELAHTSGAMLVHYSSDYVFAGDKTEPYVESDLPDPSSVYGRTKLAGECSIRERCARHLIFRTSWVFGVHGNNFLKRMLALMQTRRSLRVVADQYGAPTSAILIAEVTAHAIAGYFSQRENDDFPYGTYHLTAAGCTTWHGYAQRIARVAQGMGMPLNLSPDAIEAISTDEYPLPATRPANSQLDTSKLRHAFNLSLPPWERNVDFVLKQLLMGDCED